MVGMKNGANGFHTWFIVRLSPPNALRSCTVMEDSVSNFITGALIDIIVFD